MDEPKDAKKNEDPGKMKKKPRVARASQARKLVSSQLIRWLSCRSAKYQ
jgi:hypothetical protein